jgi:hypothetical protein
VRSVKDYSRVAIQIQVAPDRVALVRRLRQTLDAPVATLNEAAVSGAALPVCQLHGPDHDEVEDRLVKLLNDLDAMQVRYAIVLGAESVSRTYLSNILNRYREIGYEQAMLTDLESGDPSEEALEWDRRQQEGKDRDA